jgi:hypothetical protein
VAGGIVLTMEAGRMTHANRGGKGNVGVIQDVFSYKYTLPEIGYIILPLECFPILLQSWAIPPVFTSTIARNFLRSLFDSI